MTHQLMEGHLNKIFLLIKLYVNMSFAGQRVTDNDQRKKQLALTVYLDKFLTDFESVRCLHARYHWAMLLERISRSGHLACHPCSAEMVQNLPL
jgi:hypothetical protein